MKGDFKIHPIQTSILRVLLFQPEARFSELNKTGMPTDHFTFHVKRLVELGLVKKSGPHNTYKLTATGKEFANRFDTESGVLERQAKIGVLIACVKNEGRTTKYLVQQRLKQPYYGFYGFLTGKVRWGETILGAATRELKEETGLAAHFTLVGIKHKMDYSKEGSLLEDKYFFVFRAEKLRGELIEDFEGGKNLWLSKSKISKLPNLFGGVNETIEMIKQDKPIFSETKYTVSTY